MKLTNRMNLPQPLVDAVRNDGYSKGDADISVTRLIGPPRIAVLEERHAEEVTEDASERIFSLLGQVVHGILERSNSTGVAERRLFIEVEGWRVSGGMDAHYEHGLLQDYKFVTSYKFKDGGVPTEYEQQLNCYAEMLRQNGHTVNQLQIVGILRDWSKLEARRDETYPQAQVIVRDVVLWPQEQAQKFIRDRVILHQQARVELPICKADERWAKPDTWAVMKPGATRASRVYDNEAEALAHAAQTSGLYVKHRPGESVRCQAYCRVARFCSQFAAIESVERAEFEKPLVLGQGKTG